MEQDKLSFILEGKSIEISFESFYYAVLTAGSLFHGSGSPYPLPPLDYSKDRADLYAFIEETLEDLLTNELHGSGWDGDWGVTRTDEGFKVTIDYHCMAEDGYYDGWIGFTITTDKDLDIVSIENDADEEHKEHYLWDDYHESTIHETFEHIKQQLVKDKLLLRYRVV